MTSMLMQKLYQLTYSNNYHNLMSKNVANVFKEIYILYSVITDDAIPNKRCVHLREFR